MTIELGVLALCGVLMLAMPPAYGQGYIRALGSGRMLGNRENMPDVEGWFTRCKRAHANLMENLLPFAAIVLVAHAAGVHTRWTMWGAELFLVARLIHAITYTAGFVPARAPAYLAGVVGTLVVASQLL